MGLYKDIVQIVLFEITDIMLRVLYFLKSIRSVLNFLVLKLLKTDMNTPSTSANRTIMESLKSKKSLKTRNLSLKNMKKKSSKRTRAKSSNGTCDRVRGAKSSYGMRSSKILRINRLI